MAITSVQLVTCGSRLLALALALALAGYAAVASAAPKMSAPADPWSVVSTTNANKLTATVKFANGHVFSPRLYHPAVIGVLRSGTGTPYLVVDGVDCTECDATARSVYVGDPSAWPTDFSKDGWAVSYPSRNYSSTNGKLMSWSRLFVGRCVNERPGVVSFYASREEKGWSHRVDWVEVMSDRLATHATKEVHSAPTVAEIVKSVRAGRCREIHAQTTDEGDYG